MTEDRNFDDIAHKFAKNIYGSDKGDIRQQIVWEDIERILSIFPDKLMPLHILDAGGGLAQLSQKLAKNNHLVTLCDLSCEMLELAKVEIEKNQLLPQYRFVHSPIQRLSRHLDTPVDLILFHAVMEWLADPQTVLRELLQHLKPGGVVSIMFYNHHGLVYKNVVCGNIPHVLNGMPFKKRFKLQPQKGLIPSDVYRWIEDSDCQVVGKSGIRCFSDYIGNQQHMGEYTSEDVLNLERRLCREEPYLSMGRYIHVWARKN
ncbi:tRNA uridine 5-oxyacetic acid(34) methyltransferase CmoM [Vibrio sp. RC27]